MRVAAALAILLAAAGSVFLALALLAHRTRPRPTPADRRAFLNRALVSSLGVFTVAFAGGSVATLWPEVRRGFGSKITAGKHSDLLAQVALEGKPVYHREGRFYLVPYDTSDPSNRYVRAGVAAGGLMALYQKCSHLGCRVPYCPTSGWFECPCHGARFNLAGEVKNPPARAGLWRFPIEITADGSVVVDTSLPIAQPPFGVDTTGQQPAGDFCVDC